MDDLRGTTPAGIVLLTDGINTDGPPLADAAEYARRRGVPLFLVGLGSEQPVRDLKLSDLLVDDVVFVDDVVNFECKLSASGFEGPRGSSAPTAGAFVVGHEHGNLEVVLFLGLDQADRCLIAAS